MILQVNFSDGSNPWVCFSDDRREIAEHWRDWMKYHPDEARPVAYCGNYKCIPGVEHGYYVFFENEYARLQSHYYKHLGHALAALERLGGKAN